MDYKTFISSASNRNRSRIVLALDISSIPKSSEFKDLKYNAMKILSSISEYICAVKINMQLLLPLGLYGGVSDIIDLAHDNGLPVIMDCKLSDVGHTNLWATKHYFEAGFDALIVNPFVGWSEGMEPVFNVAKEYGGRGVILLVYMSHKASPESYELKIYDGNVLKPIYLIFAEKALKWGAEGVIVGGTYPNIIREVRNVIGDSIPIYTPGIGFQGGDINACIQAGSKYFIVGRSIIESKDPVNVARKFRDLSWF
ncbi:MAG: orotidine-5'-phosphate decarboxylase [Candidatus Methanomethylicia archaeon]|nr:orotidine-5'-phosphate decarboxylase [Candidatus Methanomethylicia archaeon]MCX8168837.1 orotidine-5'-phosphate decarboxylase [Candidatus Methanomethylicia archaeon]MDW7988569.1 orotidine-5'-phosphate decarboxylase [Nitrososphaerota archaeon]